MGRRAPDKVIAIAEANSYNPGEFHERDSKTSLERFSKTYIEVSVASSLKRSNDKMVNDETPKLNSFTKGSGIAKKGFHEEVLFASTSFQAVPWRRRPQAASSANSDPTKREQSELRESIWQYVLLSLNFSNGVTIPRSPSPPLQWLDVDVDSDRADLLVRDGDRTIELETLATYAPAEIGLNLSQTAKQSVVDEGIPLYHYFESQRPSKRQKKASNPEAAPRDTSPPKRPRIVINNKKRQNESRAQSSHSEAAPLKRIRIDIVKK